MRLQFGNVAPNPEFDPTQAGWRKIREPGWRSYYLMKLPVAVITFACLYVAIAAIGDTNAHIILRPGDVTLGLVAGVVLAAAAGFLALLAAHEGLHLFAHPGNGRGRDSVLGVWPSRGVVYACYDGEISRNRLLVVAALPFLTLSVAPVALFWAMGRVYLWLAFVALANGIASSFDLLVIVICLLQVPGRAILRGHGEDTYWRPVSLAAEPDAPADGGA